MLSILGLVGQFFQLIPGLTTLGTTWVNASYNAQVQEITTKLNCTRDEAVALMQMQAQIQTKWWFVAIVPPLFAVPYIAYTWKGVLWDNVIMNGAASTPALHDTLATVYLMVVAYYFGRALSK